METSRIDIDEIGEMADYMKNRLVALEHYDFETENKVKVVGWFRAYHPATDETMESVEVRDLNGRDRIVFVGNIYAPKVLGLRNAMTVLDVTPAEIN